MEYIKKQLLCKPCKNRILIFQRYYDCDILTAISKDRNTGNHLIEPRVSKSGHFALGSSVTAVILDKTLETIPANITKLLNIDKTNFVSPSPQFNVVNNAETSFGNIP
jgi:hypothetical protein